MIQINTKDYSIWDDGTPRKNAPVFEVDECIAPAIAELNKRGYTTVFCCSGHPFPSHGEAWVPIATENPGDLIYGTYKVSKEPKNNKHFDGGDYHLLFVNEPSTQSYICFADGITVPTLPNGWEIDEDNSRLVIRYNYGTDIIRANSGEVDVFLYLQKRLKIMKELYEWATVLPKIT